MTSELKFIPVSVDKCAVGVVDKDGMPISKPWRIMVSDAHLAAAIVGFKCSGDHLHSRCAGGQTVARIAYYLFGPLRGLAQGPRCTRSSPCCRISSSQRPRVYVC